MALLRKQAMMNTVAVGTDVSMVSLVDNVSFMSDYAEDNCSMMDTSCCSRLEDASMISIDKFDEDISFMDDEAEVSVVDSNYSMHSLHEGECSYMDVDSSSS